MVSTKSSPYFSLRVWSRLRRVWARPRDRSPSCARCSRLRHVSRSASSRSDHKLGNSRAKRRWNIELRGHEDTERGWGRARRGNLRALRGSVSRWFEHSVVAVVGAAVGASPLPATHELDPVERRPAVPGLDEERAAETRETQRDLPARRPAVTRFAGTVPSRRAVVFHPSRSTSRRARPIPIPRTGRSTLRWCPIPRRGGGLGAVIRCPHMTTVTRNPGFGAAASASVPPTPERGASGRP